jgi:hypothetical protein
VVKLADAVTVLFPAARPLVDYILSDDGTGPLITYWSPTLGTQPTADRLASVTQAEVDEAGVARTVAAAEQILSHSAESDHVAIRAADAAQWSFGRNDVAECVWAALALVCQRANVALPTAGEIAAQITTNRQAVSVSPQAPAPADVAARGTRRLTQSEILALIGGVLAEGGGLPTG